MNTTIGDTIEQQQIAARWWRGLQPHTDGQPNPRADRAALARLRRADLLAAMQEPATFVLFHQLGRRCPEHLPEVALCAAVLAGVRDDRTEHPARTLGPPSIDADAAAQAVMKPLRFRRLIGASDQQELLTALRRAVALAGGEINVRELAAACLNWSEPRRRRWIFEYYNAGFAAPAGDRAAQEEVQP
ncbi:MAG: type I-E CRISPR-associated protein Cse2/CasB [Stellaceae bacterium]